MKSAMMKENALLKDVFERERIIYENIPGMDLAREAYYKGKSEIWAVQYPDAAFALRMRDAVWNSQWLGMNKKRAGIYLNAYLAIIRGQDLSEVRRAFDLEMKKCFYRVFSSK